ncbi:protein odr-4 homolog [Impatiens glandulifera]|uniref:protein odr-4 homolog n=1 Tax=Impatiens glandulifera TaxID=253017 RepID=UPI001FB0B7FC|nr:protein odr-4 homolog [Impatiens glandulifera]
MVKAVVGEETQLKLLEDRLIHSGLPSQVGLVIGKLNSDLDRGFVFDLIPTPPNDAGEPACSLIEAARDDKNKGSKGKSQVGSSSLFIDKDWVAEHARQVSRMLLGGIKVVGIYVWTSESSFKNSTLTLCQTVKGVAEASTLLKLDSDDRLLIHISYSPRRWICRNCSLASNITSSSLRPCDFKLGRVLSSLQTFQCTYNFDLRLPVCCETGSNLRKPVDILRHGISSHAKELQSAKAIVDGNLVSEEDLYASDGSHKVEFLLPFMKESFLACGNKEIDGLVVFSGSVCSFAYLNSKEPLSQALLNIKEDIIMSLQSRLDIMSDESGDDLSGEIDESMEQHFLHLDLKSLRKQRSLSFPRRVFVPWLADSYICDYLQSSETVEVLKEHCVELMSMEAPTDASLILEPEIVAPTLWANSFSEVAIPFSSSKSSPPIEKRNKELVLDEESLKKHAKSADFSIIAAVFVLFAAIIVGFFLFIKSSYTQ